VEKLQDAKFSFKSMVYYFIGATVCGVDLLQLTPSTIFAPQLHLHIFVYLYLLNVKHTGKVPILQPAKPIIAAWRLGGF
jgi:hypothetical protein